MILCWSRVLLYIVIYPSRRLSFGMGWHGLGLVDECPNTLGVYFTCGLHLGMVTSHSWRAHSIFIPFTWFRPSQWLDLAWCGSHGMNALACLENLDTWITLWWCGLLYLVEYFTLLEHMLRHSTLILILLLQMWGHPLFLEFVEHHYDLEYGGLFY